MIEGLRMGPAPWTEGGVVSLELGGMGGQIALTGPHLMHATSQKLQKAHEGMRGQ